MTDFILDSAYQAAEQTLLDQQLFPVSGDQSQALLDRSTCLIVRSRTMGPSVVARVTRS